MQPFDSNYCLPGVSSYVVWPRRFLIASVVLVAMATHVGAQPPSPQPAYGVVRPLVIHAENCRLFPFSPFYRPGCEPDRVLRRRERYFNLAGDEQLDITVRQLESVDGTLGLPPDVIRLATVPLAPTSLWLEHDAPTLPGEIAEQDPIEAQVDYIEPAGEPLVSFDDLPRLVRFQPGQGEVLEVQVDVKNIPSGEYQGILAARTTSTSGSVEVVPVPITLRVKDYFPLPLTVLLIGIAVGLWVSSYVSRKKDVDEIIIQSDQLQRQVEIEPHFHETFRAKIENNLRNVLFDVRRNQVDQAQENLSAAFMLWDKWRLRPREWAELFEELDMRIAQLEKILAEIGHDQRVLRIRDAFNDIRRTATNDDAKFDDATTQVAALSEQLDRFLRVRSELDTLSKNLEQLDEAQRERFSQDLEQMQQQLNGLQLDDDTAFGQLSERTSALRNEVQTVFRNSDREQDWATVEPLAAPRRRSHESEQVRALRSVGQLVSAAQWTTAAARSRFRFGFGSARGALWRRNAFNVTGYTVLMIVLAGSGFNQLYSQDPVFGAHGFSDYMTLFAWGFGAEATRSSFAQLMSSWGHPAAARAA